eukprot:4232535-Pleurochrysis_carterae.AAC.2
MRETDEKSRNSRAQRNSRQAPDVIGETDRLGQVVPAHLDRVRCDCGPAVYLHAFAHTGAQACERARAREKARASTYAY